MATLTLPVGPAAVQWQGDVSCEIADELDTSNTRLTIHSLHLTGIANQPLQVLAPATGAVHLVSPRAPLGTAAKLVQLSPWPFSHAAELRALPSVPTFYLAMDQAIALPAEDAVVEAGSVLTNGTSHVYFGVMFQDGVSLAPATWLALLAAATGNPAWTSLVPAGGAPASTVRIRVLDHTGRPLPVAADAFEQSDETTPAGGAGDEVILNAASTHFRWKGNPRAGDEALPVTCLHETRASAAPNDWLEVPAGPGPYHVHVLDLSRWFSKPRPGVKMARFHKGCRVEPLVDGLPTFVRLIDDLRASAHPGHGAELAGWAFENILLDPDLPDTRFSTLLDKICQDGGDVRLLVNRYVNLKTTDGNPNIERVVLAPLMAGLALAPNIAALFGKFKGLETDFRGFVCLAAIATLAAAIGGSLLGSGTVKVADIIEEFETSEDLVDDFENRRPGTAVWDSYPAKFADNPLASPLPWVGLESLADVVEQVGTWHQKFQVIKRQSDGGSEYVGYAGGIDIAANRLDCPGHQVRAPFHDVHARVLGPAVADLCRTWSERYERLGLPKGGVFDVPDAATLSAQAARHLVQVGRTYFDPAGTPQSGQPLTFAPHGDSIINDNLIQAVKSARDYIYIEDQYFTPDAQSGADLADPDSVSTLADALLAAAQHCRRLLIVVPDETDQAFGDARRKYLFSRLENAWGQRVRIGTILRRPLLSGGRMNPSEGRCVLTAALPVGVSSVFLAPPSRVPADGPFWLWIDGELMRSKPGGVHGAGGAPGSLQVDVERGLFEVPRPHTEGAAVTMSQLKGIYVHAKIMMVDDVFVSIGSANLNRRGLYHDGEIGVFAVPEQLKAAPDNPARSLRTALWAEHLGLPPSMGSALLGDPIAGFEMFREERGARGRFARLAPFPPQSSVAYPPTSSLLKMALGFAVAGWETAERRSLWNVAVDPTGWADPHPEPGPVPTP